MALFSPIILIPLRAVYRLRNQFPMGYTIAPKLVSHDLPLFATVRSEQSPEEPFGGSPIPRGLKIHIYHLSILIHRSPKIVLLTIDPDKNLIDVKGIAVTAMLSLQAARIDGAELDAPEANRFPSHDDPTFSQEIFDISMAQIESVIEPDGVADDIRWESVTPICIHPPILPIQLG